MFASLLISLWFVPVTLHYRNTFWDFAWKATAVSFIIGFIIADLEWHPAVLLLCAQLHICIVLARLWEFRDGLLQKSILYLFPILLYNLLDPFAGPIWMERDLPAVLWQFEGIALLFGFIFRFERKYLESLTLIRSFVYFDVMKRVFSYPSSASYILRVTVFSANIQLALYQFDLFAIKYKNWSSAHLMTLHSYLTSLDGSQSVLQAYNRFNEKFKKSVLKRYPQWYWMIYTFLRAKEIPDSEQELVKWTMEREKTLTSEWIDKKEDLLQIQLESFSDTSPSLLAIENQCLLVFLNRLRDGTRSKDIHLQIRVNGNFIDQKSSPIHWLQANFILLIRGLDSDTIYTIQIQEDQFNYAPIWIKTSMQPSSPSYLMSITTEKFDFFSFMTSIYTCHQGVKSKTTTTHVVDMNIIKKVGEKEMLLDEEIIAFLEGHEDSSSHAELDALKLKLSLLKNSIQLKEKETSTFITQIKERTTKLEQLQMDYEMQKGLQRQILQNQQKASQRNKKLAKQVELKQRSLRIIDDEVTRQKQEMDKFENKISREKLELNELKARQEQSFFQNEQKLDLLRQEKQKLNQDIRNIYNQLQHPFVQTSLAHIDSASDNDT